MVSIHLVTHLKQLSHIDLMHYLSTTSQLRLLINAAPSLTLEAFPNIFRCFVLSARYVCFCIKPASIEHSYRITGYLCVTISSSRMQSVLITYYLMKSVSNALIIKQPLAKGIFFLKKPSHCICVHCRQ